MKRFYQKNIFARLIIAGLTALIAIAPLAVPLANAAPAPNLILNPDLTSATGSNPTNWQLGGFSDTFAGSYPVPGPSGTDQAIQVTTTVHNGGDAKWIFDNVAVEAGALYAFSDSYKSNATTTLVAAFTTASSTDPALFSTLATLPSTNGQWQNTSQQFTVPIGYPKVTVYHLISSVGTLATAHYSLSLAATAADNIFPQGLVSLTLDDGWAVQYDNALPILQNANLPATYYIAAQKVLSADTATASDILDGSVATATSTQWTNIFTDPTNRSYRFTTTYTATQPSTVQLSYQLFGGPVTTVTLGTVPAAPTTPHTASLVFTLPGNPINTVSPITITQKVASGTLTIVGSSTSLTGYDLYMNTKQVLAAQAAGIEIGNHTVNHCNLVTSLCPDAIILNSPDPLTPTQEINNASSTLHALGASPVDTFAYPYGAYNTSTKQILTAAGINAARSINAGYNTKLSDKLALDAQIVDSTTSLSQVQQWIDTALANKWWLILLFHQVEDQATITANHDVDAVTPTTFQGIINYLQAKNASVKSLHAGAALMSTNAPSNLTALTAAITAAQTKYDAAVEGTLPGQYTLGSKAIFLSAINAAKAITTADTQATVDAAVITLNNASTAFDAAKIATSNLTLLTAAITAAQAKYDAAVEGFVVGNYTPGSKAILLAAINAAKLITSADAQATIDAAVITLNNASTAFDAAKIDLQLSAEQSAVANASSITITWTTSHPATSRVLWDTVSHTLASSTQVGPPNYGYANSTVLDPTLVTSHSVGVNGLLSNTTYYFRPVSQGSPETIGNEVAMTTQPYSYGGGGGGGVISYGGGGGGVIYADTSILTAAITAAQAKHDSALEGDLPGQYIPGTKATFQSAINSAKLITYTASQATVNAAVTTLAAASAVFDAAKVGGKVLGVKINASNPDTYISAEAETIFSFRGSVSLTSDQVKLYNKLISGLSLTATDKNSIAYFLQTGTASTLRLGAGERAGVLASYRKAFGHLPQSLTNWEDIIKIANGRWTGESNPTAETASAKIFKFIYGRVTNLANAWDKAAVQIISYGLRPIARNMNSETAAIKSFRAIYKYSPTLASDWDIVRAIAYSGASK